MEWLKMIFAFHAKLYDPDGNIQIEGDWKDDKPV